MNLYRISPETLRNHKNPKFATFVAIASNEQDAKNFFGIIIEANKLFSYDWIDLGVPLVIEKCEGIVPDEETLNVFNVVIERMKNQIDVAKNNC